MPLVEQALEHASHHVPSIVIKHRSEEAAKSAGSPLLRGRDYDFDALINMSDAAPCVEMQASDPLYTIYTSGTTGDPKGILRDNAHSVMLKWSMQNYFGVAPGETFFAASDMGWVVGHSYIVYAPLLHGCTSVMFEGKPVGTPDAGVLWRAVEQYSANVLFTAPTALRAIRQADPSGEFIKQSDLSKLRALFVAGERADPNTVEYFEDVLQKPIVDNCGKRRVGRLWLVCLLTIKEWYMEAAGFPSPGSTCISSILKQEKKSRQMRRDLLPLKTASAWLYGNSI